MCYKKNYDTKENCDSLRLKIVNTRNRQKAQLVNETDSDTCLYITNGYRNVNFNFFNCNHPAVTDVKTKLKESGTKDGEEKLGLFLVNPDDANFVDYDLNNNVIDSQSNIDKEKNKLIATQKAESDIKISEANKEKESKLAQDKSINIPIAVIFVVLSIGSYSYLIYSFGYENAKKDTARKVSNLDKKN